MEINNKRKMWWDIRDGGPLNTEQLCTDQLKSFSSQLNMTPLFYTERRGTTAPELCVKPTTKASGKRRQSRQCDWRWQVDNKSAALTGSWWSWLTCGSERSLKMWPASFFFFFPAENWKTQSNLSTKPSKSLKLLLSRHLQRWCVEYYC